MESGDFLLSLLSLTVIGGSGWLLINVHRATLTIEEESALAKNKLQATRRGTKVDEKTWEPVKEASQVSDALSSAVLGGSLGGAYGRARQKALEGEGWSFWSKKSIVHQIKEELKAAPATKFTFRIRAVYQNGVAGQTHTSDLQFAENDFENQKKDPSVDSLEFYRDEILVKSWLRPGAKTEAEKKVAEAKKKTSEVENKKGEAEARKKRLWAEYNSKPLPAPPTETQIQAAVAKLNEQLVKNEKPPKMTREAFMQAWEGFKKDAASKGEPPPSFEDIQGLFGFFAGWGGKEMRDAGWKPVKKT